MIKKTKLRALSPGQWARTRIPDYECWKKPGTGFCRSNPGDVVDICVMPIFMPRYDDKDRFHWNYRVAYRGLQSSWANYSSPDGGGWIAPWDFGLIDASSNSPNWDRATSREHYEGKGKWLYEPASDDPELCPGPDWSRYECDICGRFVTPFCNDQGNIICPTCEATGLVITQVETLDHLEAVREAARQMGLSAQLERQLDFLANYGNHGYQCTLGKDFAPYSFDFAQFRLGYKENEEGCVVPDRRFIFNGGLIYQGPGSPGDGSFPSLSVSLAPGTGWFCHT